MLKTLDQAIEDSDGKQMRCLLCLPQITGWRAFPGHSNDPVTQKEPSSHLELRRWNWESKEAEVAKVHREAYWIGESCVWKFRVPSSIRLSTDQHVYVRKLPKTRKEPQRLERIIVPGTL